MDVLTALEDLNQKLKIAAGATDPEGVAHKLRTARELSASLEHQHHQAVAKASHLKTQLERHQQILNDMRMTGASSVETNVTAPSCHLRDIDATRFLESWRWVFFMRF